MPLPAEHGVDAEQLVVTLDKSITHTAGCQKAISQVFAVIFAGLGWGRAGLGCHERWKGLWTGAGRRTAPLIQRRAGRLQLNLGLAWRPDRANFIPRSGSYCASGSGLITSLREDGADGRNEKGYHSMKVLDTPRTGRLGAQVAYLSPFGTCFRSLTIPHDPRTDAQLRARRAFAASARGWGLELTESQRESWCAAAQTVPSWPSLRQYSHLSGQQFCVKINNTLRAVGQPPVAEPPPPVVFSPNVVGELSVDYDENGAVRLRLAVGTAVEDIMLYGQAPCSAGRMKHRRVCYLGLLGEATNGQCDITAPYIARFGTPRPGQKIFIVTCPHKHGWKGPDHVTSAIVPPQPPPGSPKRRQETQSKPAAAVAQPKSQTAPDQGSFSSPRVVYNGSSPGAPRVHVGLKHEHPWSILCAPVVHGVRVALARLGAPAMAGGGA